MRSSAAKVHLWRDWSQCRLLTTAVSSAPASASLRRRPFPCVAVKEPAHTPRRCTSLLSAFGPVNPTTVLQTRRKFSYGPRLLAPEDADKAAPAQRGGGESPPRVGTQAAHTSSRPCNPSSTAPTSQEGAATPASSTPFPHPQPDPASSAAELPSESLSRRNSLTVHLQRWTDRLTTALVLASSRVNTLTGTDYSGIAALRESIAGQEQYVKDRHAALSRARTAHDAALATQAASQKEVVQLLERKHSWSASDLERYMSLIRSEHTNEQGVAAAREELERCEASLESARQKVERAERKQYHEEQVWSDTIRRNSTWVTFGLMGLNILLLIVNLVLIEPWRRRRLVREIRSALDEKSFAAPEADSGGPRTAHMTGESAELEEPTLLDAEDRTAAAVTQDSSADDYVVEADLPLQVATQDLERAMVLANGEDKDELIAQMAESTAVKEESRPRRFRDRLLSTANSWVKDAWDWANYMLSDEHHVIISRVDLTTAVAEAWAIGATCMLLLFVTLPVDLSDVFR